MLVHSLQDIPPLEEGILSSTMSHQTLANHVSLLLFVLTNNNFFLPSSYCFSFFNPCNF